MSGVERLSDWALVRVAAARGVYRDGSVALYFLQDFVKYCRIDELLITVV